jgi:hypothetical protein
MFHSKTKFAMCECEPANANKILQVIAVNNLDEVIVLNYSFLTKNTR